MKKLGILFSFLILLFLVACSTNDITSETAVGQQIPVDVVSVVEFDLEKQLELSGQAMPNTIIPLFTTSPLQVLEVNKKVGDRVEIGEQILKLDDEFLRSQLRQAQRAVNELEKGIEAAKKLQASSQANVLELSRIQRELDASIDETRQLINNLSVEEGDSSLMEIIRKSLEVTLKQVELAQLGGQIGNFPQMNLTELEMQLEATRQNAKQAQLAVDATKVTSPIEGIIAEINVAQSQIAPPNNSLATVVNLDPILATFHVNNFQVVQLKEGMAATVQIDGIQEPMKSVISVVSPTINPQTNLYKIEIPIENLEHRIKGGMRVIASIHLGGIEKANVIPVESILYDENSPYVFIAENGKAIRRDIILGIRDGGVIEVHEGIKLDDKVITRGKERVTDGAEITVRNEE